MRNRNVGRGAVAVTVFGLVALVCKFGYAYMGNSGQSCAEAVGTTGGADRDKTGFFNGSSTSAIDAACPITIGYSPNYSNSLSFFQIQFDDENSSITGGTIGCTVAQKYFSGAFAQSVAKYSCSTSGGCTSFPTTSYTGVNTLYWSTTDLTFSSINADSSAVIYCTVPPRSGLNGNPTYLIGYSGD